MRVKGGGWRDESVWVRVRALNNNGLSLEESKLP